MQSGWCNVDMTAQNRPLVLVLTGPSSAGKSSLARALQTRLPVPAIWLEADRIFPTLPTEHPHWQSPGIRRAVVLAFHESIAQWAECGFNLIVDGSLPYEDIQLRAECLQLLSSFDLRIIGVTSDDASLTAREQTRPDRRVSGWAVRQSADIHEGMRHAAWIDTSAMTPGRAAMLVLDQLRVS